LGSSSGNGNSSGNGASSGSLSTGAKAGIAIGLLPSLPS
jgi:hypothetical protein